MLRRSQGAFQTKEIVLAESKAEISVLSTSMKLVLDTVSEVTVTGLPRRGFDAIRNQESLSFLEKKGN